MSQARRDESERTILETSRSPRCSGPARVHTAHGDGRVRVSDAAGFTVDARVAVPGFTPRPGDSVVVFTDDSNRTFVIGVLDAPRPATDLEAALDASEAPRRVHDRRGNLIFEYDPETDVARLRVPTGDLAIDVEQGALSFAARDGVRVASGADLTLEAARQVEVATRSETSTSRVVMRPGELAVVSNVVSVAADRAELIAARVGLSALSLESTVDRVRQVAKVIDTRAERIVERAKDSYREVERLSQTRAGQLRLVARKTAQLVGENTFLKARDRMKVKGERIHLA